MRARTISEIAREEVECLENNRVRVGGIEFGSVENSKLVALEIRRELERMLHEAAHDGYVKGAQIQAEIDHLHGT